MFGSLLEGADRRGRLINALGLLTIVSAMCFAIFYLERTLYLSPCPLCIIDRVLLTGSGLCFLVALIHNPRGLARRLYALLNVIFLGVGIGVAARHVWLQQLPPDQVPECGAGLYYMLDTLPLWETLREVLQGSGECAEIQWTFLGLSIPQQTLLLFVGLTLLALSQLLARRGSTVTRLGETDGLRGHA